MNRAIWKQNLTDSSIPSWPCPSCGTGILLLKKGTFIKEETVSSRRAKEDADWEPEWTEYRFTCLATCAVNWCREIIVVSGTGSIKHFQTSWDGEDVYMDSFEAKFVCPSPDIIQVPVSCPKELKAELKSAFSLYWSDARACANRIRSCIELLLTEKGIRRFNCNKGQRYKINLHDRIEFFKKKFQELGDALLAVKWIGNEGSHIGKLTKDDLCDAFEMLEHILDELFIKRKQKVAKLAKAINKKKGPISR